MSRNKAVKGSGSNNKEIKTGSNNKEIKTGSNNKEIKKFNV